jgi:hypothetical protein
LGDPGASTLLDRVRRHGAQANNHGQTDWEVCGVSDRKVLIIDDVGVALEQLTDYGRSVVGAASDVIRSTVLELARRRQWTVVPYGSYAKWARQVAENDPHFWLVLDPLFPRTFSASAHFLHPTRVDGRGFDLDGAPIIEAGSDIGLLDDAAASGSTLGHVVGIVHRSGARVARIAVCASSRVARDFVARLGIQAGWTDFMPGDWRILHLRDGCPYLPYSGRLISRLSHPDSGTAIELRAPSSSVVGSVWQVLNLDDSVRNAIRSARITIGTQLAASLGRPAIVQDVIAMGSSVSVVVESGAATASLDSPLKSLLVAA